MADQHESELRQPDNSRNNSESRDSAELSQSSGSLVETKDDTRTPSHTAAEEAVNSLRAQALQREVGRLSNDRVCSQFAQNEAYVRGLSEQIHRGTAPFQPMAHHVWKLRAGFGTRL